MYDATLEFRRARWLRYVEHMTTALVAAGFTAGMVYMVLRPGV